MSKSSIFLRRYSSKILTVVGATGVIATTVLAVKATPKALILIEEKKDELNTDKLTPKETIKTAWKPYVPTLISGVTTIACIVGIDCLSTKSQASLMSAYAVLDNSFKQYREKVKELYSDEDSAEHFETRIKEKIADSYFDTDMELHDDKELFFDYQSMRYFESTMAEVKYAEKLFNDNYKINGFACLNDYYQLLGLPPVDYGYQLGWDTIGYEDSESGLDFEYEKVYLEGGNECWIITMPYRPVMDYDIF